MGSRPRLLYLGFALPPELAERFPGHNPAGQRFEAALLAELGGRFDLRLVTLPGREIPPASSASPLWRDALLLPERGGPFFSTLGNLRRLRAHLRRLAREGWRPDAILAYNLSPLYNAWLRGARGTASRFCLLADSSRLGAVLSPWKRFRYALKPFQYADREMLSHFEGFVTLSHPLHEGLRAEGRESLWMPGACLAEEALPVALGGRGGPPVFGYYGALGEHSGVQWLVEAHGREVGAGPFRFCGYGKRAAFFRERCAGNPRQEFLGTLADTAATLAFGNGCDVLVNPRPASHGNENNFPSKIFSYALSGAAILTTPSGGVREVLGDSAFYLDESDLVNSLRRALVALTATPRETLRERAEEVRARILRGYTWEVQAGRAADFIAVRAKTGTGTA